MTCPGRTCVWPVWVFLRLLISWLISLASEKTLARPDPLARPDLLSSLPEDLRLHITSLVGHKNSLRLVSKTALQDVHATTKALSWLPSPYGHLVELPSVCHAAGGGLQLHQHVGCFHSGYLQGTEGAEAERNKRVLLGVLQDTAGTAGAGLWRYRSGRRISFGTVQGAQGARLQQEQADI